MNSYHYTVYGLNIVSDISCPELPQTEGLADITIRRGRLDHIMLPENHGRNHAINEHQLLIEIPKTARYLVSMGKDIIVDQHPGIPDEAMRLYLLGSALGAILHQRGILPIHGNGVIIDGKCMIFAGHSGKGKSTLAAAFAQKGYKLLSDDVCAISLEDGKPPLVWPGFPQVKLRPDAAEHLDIPWQTLRKVAPDETKYILTVHDQFSQTAAPLEGIFILGFHAGDDFAIREVRALNKLLALKKHTYRPRMISKLKKEEAHFTRCMRLATDIRIHYLLRPNNLRQVPPQIRTLLRTIKNSPEFPDGPKNNWQARFAAT